MTIESITGRVNTISPITSVKKAEVDDQKQVQASGIKKEDRVEQTTVMQGFRKAVESTSASAVDVDRVDSIKKAIAEGRYKIDAENIARKIIEFEKSLPPDEST